MCATRLDGVIDTYLCVGLVTGQRGLVAGRASGRRDQGASSTDRRRFVGHLLANGRRHQATSKARRGKDALDRANGRGRAAARDMLADNFCVIYF